MRSPQRTSTSTRKQPLALRGEALTGQQKGQVQLRREKEIVKLLRDEDKLTTAEISKLQSTLERIDARQSDITASYRDVEALTREIRSEWKVRLVFWGMAAIDPDLRKAQAQRLDRANERYAEHLRCAAQLGELEPLED